jgi:hypothetical protein
MAGWQDGKASNLPSCQSVVIAGGLFLASLSLYLTTLAPSVVTLFDDSLEFQLVTYQLGIAHPTGYPLYTLLGKLFTFLPIGNIAFRVNVMSAVFGALTVSELYLLILQLTQQAVRSGPPGGITNHDATIARSISWPVQLGGLIGAILFGVSPVFWQQATIAEVYTLSALFVAGLLLTAVYLLPRSKEGKPGLLWLALSAGLALTHHRTIVLLFPALAFYVLLNRQAETFKKSGFYKTLIYAAAWGLAPLLLYLYLPLRGHVGSLDGSYENTWGGFWRQVSAGGYGTFIFENPFQQERGLDFYWILFQNQFYTLVPGLLGLAYLSWRSQWKTLLLTATAFLTYTIFNLFYNVSDIEVFFIPPFLIWAIWSGVGATFLLQSAVSRRLTAPAFSILGVTLILAIFIFISFKTGQTTWPVLAERNTWRIHDYGLDMLQQPLPEGKAAIVGILGEMTLLRYFQQTENRRPDVETVAADQEADRLASVTRLLAEGKTVYLTRQLPSAPERWSLSAVGPLIKVNPEPILRPPNIEAPLDQAVTPAITLRGYNLSRSPHTGAGLAPLRLTMFWQHTTPITADLKVSARLLNSAGEVSSVKDVGPVHFAYPTQQWRTGEIVTDVYDLALPVNAPAGEYTPLLIWYDPAQNAAEVGRVELPPVRIE